jgi:tetratricopeptide (TPR) repeat protein
VKLFRRRPDLRFELRIHEQILPSIRRAGGEIARAPIHVLHANYDRSPEGQRKKRERDQRLLALDLAENPEHPFVHFNAGMTACHEGDYARAVQHLRTSIDLSAPSDSQVRKAYALLASAFRALGESDRALAACGEGLRHSPDDAELLLNLALAHRLGGDLAQAEAALRRLLSVSQQGGHLASVDTGIFSYKARHNLAAVLQESGKPEEAEAAWQEVTAERPEFLPAWLALGELLLAQGREDELERLSRRAQRVDGATGELLRALAASRAGDLSRSEGHLRAALAKRPDLLEARRLLSHALLQRGERNEAEEVLRELLVSAPEDAEAHHNLGTLLLETGRAGDAVPHLERAVALRPRYRPSRDALAVARRAEARSAQVLETVG